MNGPVLIADIEGYAAIFGAPDLNGDVIAPGAFKKTLTKRAQPVRMLYQHAAEAPIGRWTAFVEDARGLFVTGEILLASPTAREVHALLSGGAVDGLSIGYQTVKARKGSRSATRRIIEAELWEVSVVTFPMAAGARVTHIGAPRPDSLPQEPLRALPILPPGRARPARRASAPPTGARQLVDAQFAHALRGAASILSV